MVPRSAFAVSLVAAAVLACEWPNDDYGLCVYDAHGTWHDEEGGWCEEPDRPDYGNHPSTPSDTCAIFFDGGIVYGHLVNGICWRNEERVDDAGSRGGDADASPSVDASGEGG